MPINIFPACRPYQKTRLFPNKPFCPQTRIRWQDEIVISKLPCTIATVLNQLNLDSPLNRLVSCPTCFATYPDDSAPRFCISTLTDELPGHPPSCGTPLLKTLVPKPVPFCYFSYQSMSPCQI
ncbi:hypothetical protein VP01_8764g1 [Puccinia sorghi]|uniref:Uncharacterized protein n=1 Tax=Puccinia sorghi TaxID=27349 RepID=A0A0L6U9A6_9BASI|nr:hypothetical protein VP01_8764g1 [Puccinia sorghi]